MTSFQSSMQTSGFLTRSVASFAISRNFARAPAPGGRRSASRRCETEELLPVAALLVHLAQVVDGRRVVGVDREDLLVGLHRLGLVGELRDVEIGGLRVELDLLGVARDDRRELEQRLDVLVVALGCFLLVGELRASSAIFASSPACRSGAQAGGGGRRARERGGGGGAEPARRARGRR